MTDGRRMEAKDGKMYGRMEGLSLGSWGSWR